LYRGDKSCTITSKTREISLGEVLSVNRPHIGWCLRTCVFTVAPIRFPTRPGRTTQQPESWLDHLPTLSSLAASLCRHRVGRKAPTRLRLRRSESQHAWSVTPGRGGSTMWRCRREDCGEASRIDSERRFGEGFVAKLLRRKHAPCSYLCARTARKSSLNSKCSNEIGCTVSKLKSHDCCR
jgi:hypothetical protein